jgi:hypothetical protein
MNTEAYVHVVPHEDEPDVWRLSVSYGDTLAQIRIHGNLWGKGSAKAQLPFELDRLAKELSTISVTPSAIHWQKLDSRPPRRPKQARNGEQQDSK